MSSATTRTDRCVRDPHFLLLGCPPRAGGPCLLGGLLVSKPFVHLCLVRPVAVIDCETTGTSPKSDRIIEVAALKFFPSGERVRFVRRVNPLVPIPAAATAVHGITD